MVKVCTIAIGLLLLAGCARERAVVIDSHRVARTRVANLALSPDEDTNRLAVVLERSDWPATELGYRFDDTVTYATFGYEAQINFDEFNDLLWGSELLQTGTLLRSGW